MQAINSLHTLSLSREDEYEHASDTARHTQRVRTGGAILRKYDESNTAHRSTPESLEGAFVPDLVFALPSSSFFDDEANSGTVIDLEAVKAQYLPQNMLVDLIRF